MDTLTSGELARELGTSVPRVHRAMSRLGIEPERTPGGHARLHPGEAGALRRELGTRRAVPGLTRTQVLVLAVLSRHPLGLVSARAVARRAGASPTAVSGALEALLARGIVGHDEHVVLCGKARTVALWLVRYDSPAWLCVAERITAVSLPRRPSREKPKTLPRDLAHLFWNVAHPERIDLDAHGVTVAHRILTSHDPVALAWAASTLAPETMRQGAAFRDVDARSGALAANLAS